MEIKDWLTIGLSLLATASGFWAVYISGKRANSQGYKEGTEANLNALAMAEKATEMAKEARDDNEKILKAIGGQASISGFFQVEDLIKNGEAPLIDGKIILKRDMNIVKNVVGTSSKH